MHHSGLDHGSPEYGRLSVRPSMASGTRTLVAGVQRLDSLYPGDSMIEGAFLYVPKRCVGTQRYPLVMLLHGSNGDGLMAVNADDLLFQHFADSLGYILLAPTSYSSDRGWGHMSDSVYNVDIPRIDAVMRTVLQHYAIDPKRIILMGGSAGAGGAVDLGYVNGDVFSHVIGFEGFEPFWVEHEFDFVKPHGKAEFFFGMSTVEGDALKMPAFISWMRKQGYSATYVGDGGTHAMTLERGKTGYDWLTSTKGWRDGQ